VNRRQYSEADAEILQEVANQVALAFENMKSYEEIATLKARLEKENIYLREEIRTQHNFEEIVGSSPIFLEVLRAVEQVASVDSTVLVYGETGTGKELIARAIHNRSARSNSTDFSCRPSGSLIRATTFGTGRKSCRMRPTVSSFVAHIGANPGAGSGIWRLLGRGARGETPRIGHIARALFCLKMGNEGLKCPACRRVKVSDSIARQ
jgi:hypothetical protein